MLPGFPEMAIVLVLVLILFGAGKLPEVFGSMGEGVKRFRDAQKDIDAITHGEDGADKAGDKSDS